MLLIKSLQNEKNQMSGSVYIAAFYGQMIKRTKNIMMWVECDRCKRQMHSKCMPKFHKDAVQFDSVN